MSLETSQNMAQAEEADDYSEQLGFVHEMFDLFDLKEVVCHGNGLIIDGCGIEENLLWETEYLQLQIRGDENKTILYVPRFTENPRLIRKLQHQFNLCYSIILGFIAAGAPEHKLREELRQVTAKMRSSYLQGQILSLNSTGMFATTKFGKPVRSETVVVGHVF